MTKKKIHQLRATITDDQIKVGDWILATRGGKLTISEVRFIRKNDTELFGIPTALEIITSEGIFYAGQILELRRGN